MKNIRYRQIHLDFHTSEYIQGIGSKFNPEAFARTLAEANVDSVTCFARCHHGWLYYPSEKYADLIHPNLENKNLLPEQIQACHAEGINVPIYTTVQWDGRVAREHPEWLSIDGDGNYINTQRVEEPHFYYTLCLNSGYRQFFRDNLEDIINVIGPDEIDGFFMDIFFPVDCGCSHCRKKMLELKMNPDKKGDRMKYSFIMLDEFKAEITEFIREQAGDVGIFYNSSHISPASKDSFKDYSHLELESLPSGGWGYDHFPAVSRYARNLGKEMIGMTGKFHTYWGDFHSLKNKAALEFECFNMLAMGAGCSIGDQLHPNGMLSDATYELIGDIYSSVKEKEDYCRGAEAAAQIAVLNPEEFYDDNEYDLGISPSLIGTVRMLQELSYQFDIIDSSIDLGKYKLLILPDCIRCDTAAEKIIKDYIVAGGKVLGSWDSALPKDGSGNIYGIRYLGESEYTREFVMPNNVIGKNLPKEEFVMYGRGYDVAAEDAEILMDKIKPYFERSGKTFCSHQHAPSSGIVGAPAVTINNGVIYFSHPIFSLYRKNAALWCKKMVDDAIGLLLHDRLITHNGPSTLVTSLHSQKDYNRDVLNLLHYITEKRSEDIYTIEDKIPLHGLEFKLWSGDRRPSKVFTVPAMEEIKFSCNGEQTIFEIEKMEGHCMVCIQY